MLVKYATETKYVPSQLYERRNSITITALKDIQWKRMKFFITFLPDKMKTRQRAKVLPCAARDWLQDKRQHCGD